MAILLLEPSDSLFHTLASLLVFNLFLQLFAYKLGAFIIVKDGDSSRSEIPSRSGALGALLLFSPPSAVRRGSLFLVWRLRLLRGLLLLLLLWRSGRLSSLR